MMRVIFIVATATLGFYLRFLWAMTKELRHLRSKRPKRHRWQPVVRRNLFRLDPADLWAEKSDDSSRSQR